MLTAPCPPCPLASTEEALADQVPCLFPQPPRLLGNSYSSSRAQLFLTPPSRSLAQGPQAAGLPPCCVLATSCGQGRGAIHLCPPASGTSGRSAHVFPTSCSHQRAHWGSGRVPPGQDSPLWGGGGRSAGEVIRWIPGCTSRKEKCRLRGAVHKTRVYYKLHIKYLSSHTGAHTTGS